LNITQYLLRDTGSEAKRLSGDIRDSELVVYTLNPSHFFSEACAGPPNSSPAIGTILKQLELYGEYNITDIWRVDAWAWLGVRGLKEKNPQLSADDLIEWIALYRGYGASFVPFKWYGPKNESRYLLELYLKAGGDPNWLDEDGWPPLALAMWEMKNSDDELEPGISDLLTPLIQAGADICYLHVLEGDVEAWSLADMAYAWGVGDAWFEALENCGFDVAEVLDESDRQVDAFRKLHGARRSGVDVSSLVNQSRAGLRHRGGRTMIEDD